MARPMDWRTISDDREKYSAYLCSREWWVKREAVKKRCNGICERCGRNQMDSCRHLTYERKYCEELTDLQGICKDCHEFTHGKNGFDPADFWLPLKIESTPLPGFPLTGVLVCPFCSKCEVAPCKSQSFVGEYGLQVAINFTTKCGQWFRVMIASDLICAHKDVNQE